MSDQDDIDLRDLENFEEDEEEDNDQFNRELAQRIAEEDFQYQQRQQQQLVKYLVEEDIIPEELKEFYILLAKTLVLTNLDEKDIPIYELQLQNIIDAYLMGKAYNELRWDEYYRLEELELVAWSIFRRSKGGWTAELLHEQIHEVRTVQYKPSNARGGLLRRLFGNR